MAVVSDQDVEIDVSHCVVADPIPLTEIILHLHGLFGVYVRSGAASIVLNLVLSAYDDPFLLQQHLRHHAALGHASSWDITQSIYAKLCCQAAATVIHCFAIYPANAKQEMVI
jgi:hypothetical protein